MATVSPIQSHNATRLIFVYKSDVIGPEVYSIDVFSIVCRTIAHLIKHLNVFDSSVTGCLDLAKMKKIGH